MNNDLMRNRFLSRLSRTARSNYSKRRTCLNCGKPIVNKNLSGLCGKCEGRTRFHKRGESREHKELKLIAQQFLKMMGCTDVTEEYILDRKRIDVVGINGKGLIAVECGGSLDRKLRHLASKVSELYILPYGISKPFRWKGNMSICKLCGNRV